jgi:hypothetical protein
VAQVILGLKEMCKLLAKYGLPDPSSGLKTSIKNVTGANGIVIRTATKKVVKTRQKLNQQTGRLKKMSFGWGVNNSSNDKQKFQEFVQQLKY